MVMVNVAPIEVETRTRHGDLVRADVYLPKDVSGPVPVLFVASPYQKSLRRLPAHWVFPFIEYGPIQLYLDEGYAYVAMDVPGTGRSEGTWDFVSRAEGEAIHDMIEHVASQDRSTGDVGIVPGEVYALRVELIPMSFLVRAGERITLEISNWDSLIADAPMTHFYGQKVGTDTFHHDVANPSQLRLHERPRDPSNIIGDAA